MDLVYKHLILEEEQIHSYWVASKQIVHQRKHQAKVSLPSFLLDPISWLLYVSVPYISSKAEGACPLLLSLIDCKTSHDRQVPGTGSTRPTYVSRSSTDIHTGCTISSIPLSSSWPAASGHALDTVPHNQSQSNRRRLHGALTGWFIFSRRRIWCKSATLGVDSRMWVYMYLKKKT